MPLDVDLDRVRAALGIGYDEGAAWFSVPDADTSFASHKARHRALLLRRWADGPSAWVIPRSTTSSTGLEHAPHAHRVDFPDCWLNLPARIVLDRQYTVRRSLLTARSYMCAEPNPAVSAAVLASPQPW